MGLLRRYFHSSREFLVYGHALSLGPAPEFVRDPEMRLPTHLIAMPALLGPQFPQAMRSFCSAPAWRDLLVSGESGCRAAAAELAGVMSELDVDAAVAQWFPGITLDIRLVPDLTGLPGQVVAANAGVCQYFACAPSLGKCRWDSAHIGAAVLLEVLRPLVETAIASDDSLQIAARQGLSRILAQVRANGQAQSLKQAFLLANPDFRTRLVEIVSRALVAVSLGRALGRGVSRAYLNEQQSAVGGEAVDRVADNLLRHLRLAPRAGLASFLRSSQAELEAPLFARIAAN